MKFKVFFSAIGLISVFGCAPSIKITSEFQDPTYSFGQIKKNESIKVIAAEKINVMEFQKSYRKEYATDHDFATSLQSQITDGIKSIIGCKANGTGTQQEASILVSGSFDQNSIDQIQQLFGSTSETLILLVKSVDISNKRTSNGSMMMASPGGGMMMTGGGSQESCVVTLNVELWDVKTKKKVLAYSATGEAKVTMLFFGTALKNAVSNAIKYMVNYPVTGLTT